MSITISPEVEASIREKVENGLYASPMEAIETAMRLLDERDRKVQAFQAEVEIGLAQVERGEVIDFTPDMMERLMREAEENARRGHPVKDVVKP